MPDARVYPYGSKPEDFFPPVNCYPCVRGSKPPKPRFRVYSDERNFQASDDRGPRGLRQGPPLHATARDQWRAALLFIAPGWSQLR